MCASIYDDVCSVSVAGVATLVYKMVNSTSASHC